MIPTDLTREVKNRLKTTSGQIEAIVGMLDKDAEPAQVLVQFKAIEKSIQSTRHLLLDEVYRKALAIKIVHVEAQCPGNCGREDRIQEIKRQFPTLDESEISAKYAEMIDIQKAISDLMKK